MGIPRIPGPVKIFAGLIFNDPRVYEKAYDLISRKIGSIDSESDFFSFNHTGYYNDEMGGGLMRKFLAFARPIRPEGAYKLKLLTQGLEKKFSHSGRRSINIDPGYLTLSKLVLLTTKDYSHRLYLKNGIYAEVTLLYKNGTFQPWQWTYPDYKTREYIEFFNSVREKYHQRLMGHGNNA